MQLLTPGVASLSRFAAHSTKAALFCLASLVCVSLLASPGYAANRYVRAGANGSGNGSDWANAYPALPSTLVRGDTYYVADGTYGGYRFDDTGSTMITIKKATAADHGTDAGWSSTFGDGEALFTGSGSIWTFAASYITIDGQVGSGKAPGKYGFRLYGTDNRCNSGTSLVRYATRVTNLTLRHTEFDWNNGTAACIGGVTKMLESGVNTSDYITIESNFFHHSSGFVFYLGNYTGRPVQDHYNIANNYFYANGGGGSPSAHWELMWLTDLKNSNIYNNTIEDTFGATDSQTGWVMLGGADTVNIFGNLFFCSSSNCGFGGNGVIGTWSNDTYRCNAIHIYNNTFANLSGGYGPKIYFRHNSTSDTDIQVKNNVYFNSKFQWTGVTSQSNESCGGGQGCSGSSQQTGITSAFFKNAAAFDYRLAAATPSGDSSIANQLIGSVTDMAGAKRGADGNWDRGAFEFGSASGPLPPTGLRVITE